MRVRVQVVRDPSLVVESSQQNNLLHLRNRSVSIIMYTVYVIITIAGNYFHYGESQNGKLTMHTKLFTIVLHDAK